MDEKAKFKIGDKVRVKNFVDLEEVGAIDASFPTEYVGLIGIVTEIEKRDDDFDLYKLDTSDMGFFDDEIELYNEDDYKDYNVELVKLLKLCNKNKATILRFSLDDNHAIVEDYEGRVSLLVYNEKEGEWK